MATGELEAAAAAAWAEALGCDLRLLGEPGGHARTPTNRNVHRAAGPIPRLPQLIIPPAS